LWLEKGVSVADDDSAIEIADSDDDSEVSVVKKEVLEEENEGVSKHAKKDANVKMEVLQKQLDEQRKESDELKKKIEEMMVGGCNRGPEVNAALSGVTAHPLQLMHPQYGVMGTMNPYGSHFGVAHPPGYAHHQYSSFAGANTLAGVFAGANTPAMAQSMPSHYGAPPQNPFVPNQRRDDDEDEKAKQGSTYNFSCAVS